MYNSYRYLVDIRQTTPTNFNLCLRSEAKKLGISTEQLSSVIKDFDRRCRYILQSVYEVVDLSLDYCEEGTSAVSKKIIQFEVPRTVMDAQLLADCLWPHTYCTHSYDCCARWYSSWPRITQLSPDRFEVTQQVYQNI